MKINLLDCTLRDGGYLNDWLWGKDTILYIFQKLQSAGVDFVEIGYIRENDIFNPDRSVFPDIESIETLFESTKKNIKISAMIDFGAISIDKIKDNTKGVVDILRITFRKNQITEAMEFCKWLKKKKYNIFLQPVSVTSYSDREMLDLIDAVNEVKPVALSIVDSYGLAEEEKVIKYFYLMDNNLSKNIAIAYHSHNNFQLAYSNSTKLMEIITKRNLYFDGSLYGMGKSAGNCNLELLAMYLNKYHGKNYNLSEILDIIDMEILKLSQKYSWGYQLPFFVSALNDCHPNYVNYLLEKNHITVKDINNILKNINDEKRLIFDKNYIESIYNEYQMKAVDDKAVWLELEKKFKNKTILLLSPGISVTEEREKIRNYIENNKVIKISLNHVNKFFETDYIFISNAKRFEQFQEKLKLKCQSKMMITSNINDVQGMVDYIFNFNELFSAETPIGGTSLYLLTKILIKLKAEKIVLAGFDGFSKYSENFYDTSYDFYFKEKNIDEITDATMKQIARFRKEIKIEFLTKSRYKKMIRIDIMYDAVVFDIDGTLIDTKPGIKDAVCYTIDRMELVKLNDDQLEDFVGCSPIQTAFKKFCNVDNLVAQKCADAFREYYNQNAIFNSTPYDNIIGLLNLLKSKNIKLGVATFKRQDSAEILLKHLNLYKYFDGVFGAPADSSKTKKDILNDCLKYLNTKNAVFIGDSLSDLVAAKELCVDFIAVTYGYGFKNINEIDGCEFVKNIMELEYILK